MLGERMPAGCLGIVSQRHCAVIACASYPCTFFRKLLLAWFQIMDTVSSAHYFLYACSDLLTPVGGEQKVTRRKRRIEDVFHMPAAGGDLAGKDHGPDKDHGHPNKVKNIQVRQTTCIHC